MSGTPSQELGRVDEQIRTFWSTPPSSGEAPRSRACTMNLVVVAATPDRAREWMPTVDAVIQNVPARAILVGLDPDGDDGLESSVTAVCAPDDRSGSAVVCSERVLLIARGASSARLPSCVDALSATDVPLTLVWLARVHADDPTFTPLARQANRIVLDTARSSLASLAHVMRWMRERPERERPGIADLAWTRLGPWQELCARLFDSARLLPLSERVTRLHLVQASGASGTIGAEGALLLGWLATRLGWKAASLAGKLRLLRRGGGYVRVDVRAQSAPWTQPGSLLALELDAGSPELSLEGAIVRGEHAQADAATWSLQVTSNGKRERLLEQNARLRASDPARLLVRTLHRPPRDEALAAAIAWADELRGEELTYD